MKKFSILAMILILTLSINVFAAEAPSSSASSAAPNSPKNIFIFEKDEVPEIYLTNQNTPMYLLIPDTNEKHAEIVKAFAETKVVQLSKYNPDSGVNAGFFIISKSGKMSINLLPGNILAVDGVPYGTTGKQYQRLLELGNDHYKDARPIAQWCASMNYRNIVNVSVSKAPGENLKDIPAGNVLIAAKELHELDGSKGSAYFPGTKDLENWNGRVKIVYTFENGLKYNVYANNSYLFIECDGMSYSCQYAGDYSAYLARVKELAARPVTSVASTDS